jgi:hypothetical protein
MRASHCQEGIGWQMSRAGVIIGAITAVIALASVLMFPKTTPAPSPASLLQAAQSNSVE